MLINKCVPQTTYDIYQAGNWIETFEVQDDATAIEYGEQMYTSNDRMTILNDTTGEKVFEGPLA